MTREEFVKGYAERSGASDKWAAIGLVDFGNGWKMIALPCACGAASCEGWAVVGIEQVSYHLAFDAPEKLSIAYRDAIGGLIA